MDKGNCILAALRRDTVSSFLQEWLPISVAVVSAILQVGILIHMKKRNLRAQFPAFFNYNIYVISGIVISIAVNFLCRCTSIADWSYWTLSIFLIGFEFALMYEVFVAALKPYSALIDLGKMLFRWAGVFLLLAAILTAFATASPSAGKISAAINLLERSMRLMECGLLLLFLLFERKLGLSWRSTSMSIVLGLGVYSAIGLAVLYLQSKYPEQAMIFSLVENVSYFGAVVFWLINIKAPVAANNNVLDSPSRLIFQRWNEALVSYGHRGGDAVLSANSMESFLPGVEQTVDRILARKMVQ